MKTTNRWSTNGQLIADFGFSLAKLLFETGVSSSSLPTLIMSLSTELSSSVF